MPDSCLVVGDRYFESRQAFGINGHEAHGGTKRDRIEFHINPEPS